MLDSVRLAVFHNLFSSIADEMGVTIERTAYSPNIKERKDFSCALFSPDGEMIAQAAHIPVHLGAMPLSVAAAIERFTFEPGDVVILNDPYMGGSHLPDITMITPVFAGSQLIAFAANRAHHNDVGGMSPGSMPLASDIFQEGVRIPPIRLYQRGLLNEDVMALLLANVRVPRERQADLEAQVAGNRRAAQRLIEMTRKYGIEQVREQMNRLLDYTETLMRRCIAEIPSGVYTFEDVLDDDGRGTANIPIRVSLSIEGDTARRRLYGQFPASAGAAQLRLRRHAVSRRLCVSLPARSRNADQRRRLPGLRSRCTGRKRRQRTVSGACRRRQCRNVAAHCRRRARRVGSSIAAAHSGGRLRQHEQLDHGRPRCAGSGVRLLRNHGRRHGRPRLGRRFERGANAHDQHQKHADRGAGASLSAPRASVCRSGTVRAAPAGTAAATASSAKSKCSFPRTSHCSPSGAAIRRMAWLAALRARRDAIRLRKAGSTQWEELPAKVQLELDPGDMLRIETPGGGGYGEPEADA